MAERNPDRKRDERRQPRGDPPAGDRAGPEGTGPLERVRALAPLIRSRVAWTDAHRQPAPEVMRAMAEAGLLRLLAPSSYGGHELTLAEFLAVVEELSWVDGSAGWTVMTTNEELEIAAAYLPADTMVDLLAAQPDVVVAGSGVPSGQARPVEGGWLVDGRWQFVTASPVADRLVVCSLIDAAERPRRQSAGNGREPLRGRARLCFTLVPRDEAEVLDTWRVEGLRGTGSHDVVLRDRFVPDRWAGCPKHPAVAVPDTPFYRLPPGLRFPFPKVAVAAGIARAALGDFAELATERSPKVTRGRLRDRPGVAEAIAEAEGRRGSGWSYVHDLLAEVWDCAEQGRPVPLELHARARLACSYSVHSSVRAVELVCAAAGTSANFVDGPLSRHFRDVHAVPQHFMVAPYQMTSAGRVLLGLDPDDPTF
jgi:alkylation response protein AidB-like acyl-CoA dehydrogenase